VPPEISRAPGIGSRSSTFAPSSRPPNTQEASVPQTASPAPPIAPDRLARLHNLIVQHGISDLGRSYLDGHLAAGDGAEPRLPRYAGIIVESGDEYLILACSVEELASDMAGHAVEDVPKMPVALIDLDTGEQRTAEIDSTVRFAGVPSTPTTAPADEETFELVTISHPGRDDHWLARSKAQALAHIHAYVRKWWTYEVQRGSDLSTVMPSDPAEAVAVYFEKVEGEAWTTETLAMVGSQNPVP
jgi:hypothetical protein